MKGFWERLFGKRRAEARPPEPANDGEEDLLEDLRDEVRREVAAGFENREGIVEKAVAAYEDVADRSFLEIEARRLADEALAEHRDEQRAWPAQTDCDRLDAAFAALDKAGIVARQNFTCCGTCGLAEIDREIAAAGAEGVRTRGYAFYHWQDTEAAVDGYGLCLYYGSCFEGEALDLAIGHEIVAELERHGLSPQWNGEVSRRIELPLDWKRRRPAEEEGAAVA